MYLVFTRMPAECYRRRLRSLLLYLWYVFRALINSLVCWLLEDLVVNYRWSFEIQTSGSQWLLAAFSFTWFLHDAVAGTVNHSACHCWECSGDGVGVAVGVFSGVTVTPEGLNVQQIVYRSAMHTKWCHHWEWHHTAHKLNSSPSITSHGK